METNWVSIKAYVIPLGLDAISIGFYEKPMDPHEILTRLYNYPMVLEW